MKLMRLLDWKLLKLGIGTGVVLGLTTVIGMELIDVSRLGRYWQAGQELGEVGLGVVFGYLNAGEIEQWSGYQVIGRYVRFLLMVLIVWGLWLTMLVVISERAESLKSIEEVVGNGSASEGIRVLGYLQEAIKLIGLGLLPVMGYKLITKRSKNIKT